MRTKDQKKPAVNIFRRSAVIMAVSLGLGVLFNVLFYGHAVGLSFPVFTITGLIVVVVMARVYKVDMPQQAAITAAPLLFFSCMVYVRANGWITFCNIVATLYLTLLMLYLMYRPSLRSLTLVDYLRLPFRQLGAYARGARNTVATFAGFRQFVRKHEHFPQIIRGVAIAAPLLVLCTALFASADLVFRRYVGDLFSWHINGSVLAQTIIIAVATFTAMGALTCLLHQPADLAPNERRQLTARFGSVEMTILFSSLNILFLAFILIQLAYLFGGERIIGQGYTYAQYARKGFFELIAVATISCVVILVSEKLLARQAERHSRRFRWLSVALVVQVLVILASAFKRLNLYENAYGFTSLRFYSHVVIVWLAVLLGVLVYKIIRSMREGTFSLVLFGSVLVVLAGMNLMNVDGFIARQNIARYHATGKIDAAYLASLSEDAVPTSVQLLQAKDLHVRVLYAGTLARQRELARDDHNDWRSQNVSRARAQQVLDQQQEPSLRNGYFQLTDGAGMR